MIVVNPDLRISAAEALNHEWIIHKGGEHVADDHHKSLEIAKLNTDVIENLRKYKGKSVIKRAAVNTLVKHL